ncbi:transposase [Pseudarthrobacter sp. lyk4-40-TYG-27]|uniref:transposase n=1 Tax=Pseudarthrobacter sp. lyk4-40-TYG-27 TaxID=3040305 RepID=UPI00255333C1|nr:transposase [Pseudarthrobacter sp. lyk4-40-TYG-27]
MDSLPPSPVRVVYEAGPTGFGLARFLLAAGIDTVVAAPSKLQRPSGDRVKTDARDAVHLARLLKLGEITRGKNSISGPGGCAGSSPFPRRRSRRSDAFPAPDFHTAVAPWHRLFRGRAWTGTHEFWLARQRFENPARQLTYESSLEAMHEISDRRVRLDQAITAMAYASEYTPGVRSLQCLRGVSTVTAFGLAVEIGDWDRFTGSTIGAYLGLVPTEHFSGQSRSQGSITKTGNSHARRLLVEAAWHHRRPYNNPSRLMRSAGKKPPPKHEPAATPATGTCTNAGSATSNAASARSSPTSPSPANSPAGAGPWPPAHIRPAPDFYTLLPASSKAANTKHPQSPTTR